MLSARRLARLVQNYPGTDRALLVHTYDSLTSYSYYTGDSLTSYSYCARDSLTSYSYYAGDSLTSYSYFCFVPLSSSNHGPDSDPVLPDHVPHRGHHRGMAAVAI